MKLRINFLCCPGKSHGVLAHLKSRSSNTTSVSCFTRHEQNTVLLEISCSIKSSRHVRTLNYIFAAVCNKCLSTIKSKLVLGSTWKVYITFDVPDSGTFCVRSTLNTVCVLFDTSTFYFFDIFHNVKLDSFRIINISVGVTHSNNLSAKLLSFFYSIDCNVSGSCYDECLSINRIVMCFHDLIKHINNTISGSLCTD